MTFTVAVDAMGGDLGPRIAFEAAQKAVKHHNDLRILLFAHSDERQWLEAEDRSDRISVKYSDTYVCMDDKPSVALRRKQNSTMADALRSLEKEAHACVSCGNSGALMALSRYILNMHIGVERPAMATDMPSRGKPVMMLDLGANVDVSGEQLAQFALMGAAWRKAQGMEDPAVRLLNIGKEDNKGTPEIRIASQMLSADPAINYAGYVEGDELFSGEHDVIVCDGFSGNVALKTSEGVLGLALSRLQESFSEKLMGRIAHYFASSFLEKLSRSLDPIRHSGAVLLGVQGVVVKSHGKSGQEALYHSLTYALEQVRSGVADRFPLCLDEMSR